jgi:hypothetical protein
MQHSFSSQIVAQGKPWRADALRSGRSLRQPGRHAGQRKRRIVRDMISIRQRPPEADDRAVPVTGRATC